MRTVRRTFVAVAVLALAGLSPAKTGEAAEGAKGVVVEVQDLDNARVTFELREAGPSHTPDAGVLRFTKKLGPTLEQTTWFEKALAGDVGLREIRIADEPLKFRGAGGGGAVRRRHLRRRGAAAVLDSDQGRQGRPLPALKPLFQNCKLRA